MYMRTPLHGTMKRAEFRAYKQRFIRAAREVLRGQYSPVLAEAAFPAYVHPNPLIRFLFWERIRRVMQYLGDVPRKTALDFGCGGGVMLPFLAERVTRVVAMDVDLGPLTALQPYIPHPANVEVYDARRVTLADIERGSVDLVLALDVLEHVSDLEGTVRGLYRLLAPCGVLIVSGPTENLAYRLGRRVAGREFTGDYHVRGIAEIRRALAALGPVETVATLYHPVPLFQLYALTVPAAGGRAAASSEAEP